MEPLRNERAGLHRPKVPSRVPRSVPDEEFNEIFAKLPSHRDRALVAFYVSTGARASELLSATLAGVDPGRQLITVVRKGTRELQELPASTDAFVWLRLYQVEMKGLVPKGRRRPCGGRCADRYARLPTMAAHRMFERAGEAAGSTATRTRCGTPRPIGWPRTRRCRSPMSSSSSAGGGLWRSMA
jgi:site-specific recombinase XerD